MRKELDDHGHPIAAVLATHHLTIARRLAEARRERRSEAFSSWFPPLGVLATANLFSLMISPKLAAGFLVLGLLAVIASVRARSAAAEVTPDQHIRRVRRVYIPFRILPFDGERHLVLDESGVLPGKDLQFRRFTGQKALEEAYTRWCATLQDVPALLGTGHQRTHQWSEEAAALGAPAWELYEHEAYLTEAGAAMLGALDSVEDAHLTVHPAHEYPGLCEYFANGGGRSILGYSPASLDSASGIDELASLLHAGDDGNGRDAKELELWLGGIAAGLESLGAALDRVRRVAIDDVLGPHLEELIDIGQYYAFTFFCPHCNAAYLEHLKSRRFTHDEEAVQAPTLNRSAVVRYLPSGDVWRCMLCTRSTKAPFPVPRLMAEAFLPAFAKLLDEHHVERLGVYDQIADQKRHYAHEHEKELAQKLDQQRQEAKAIGARLRELEAQSKGLRSKVLSFGATIAARELMERSHLAEIEEQTRSTQQKIETGFAQFQRRFQENVSRIQAETASVVAQQQALAREESKAQHHVLQGILAAQQENVANTAQLVEHGRRTSAVSMAFARRAGLLEPKWFNFGARFRQATGDLDNALRGGSAVDRYLE